MSEVDISDPEFLEWESGLVGGFELTKRASPSIYGEEVDIYRYKRGPSASRGTTMQYAGPMFSLKRDIESGFAGNPTSSMAMSMYFSSLTPEQEQEDAIW